MKKIILVLAIPLLLAGVAFGGYQLWWNMNYYSVDRIDYHKANSSSNLNLVDDRLTDKDPQFDPELVDSRLLEGGYQINQSAAIIKLDLPDMKPDRDEELFVLQPSYVDAMNTAKSTWGELLPSANLLDGAAKQFDDGLYAALDLAVYNGEFAFAPALPEFVYQLYQSLDEKSSAKSFLAAALELADDTNFTKGIRLNTRQNADKQNFLNQFNSDTVLSKPIGFYTWNNELEQVWKVGRFLQWEFTPEEPVVKDLAKVIQNNAELQKQYEKLVQFYSRLTNPPQYHSLFALIDETNPALTEPVSVLPGSTSRETELFNRLYPTGPPAGTNLMNELIQSIRSGEVDLAPAEQDGWYSHQVFALETLLMPSRGEENQKLLLTARYKKRLIEAFKSMMTKRRETHSRMAKAATDAKAMPPSSVEPRLRIEPCATFYLRTARAYSFLQNFLEATIDVDKMKSIHGMTATGQRPNSIRDELESIKNRFYGFYLIACEDIGLKDSLALEEGINKENAKSIALKWLETMNTDADLKCDTRVSVPIFVSTMRGETHCWGTLGIRLVRLKARFETPPSIRADAESDWQQVERHEMQSKSYIIAVDEFANFVVRGNRAFSRAEFRAVCDQHKTKEKIVAAFSKN